MRVSSDHRPNAEFLSELLVVPLALAGQKPVTKAVAKPAKGRKASKAGVSPWDVLEPSSIRILKEIDRAVGGELISRIKALGFRFEANRRFDLQLLPKAVEGAKQAQVRQIRLFIIGTSTKSAEENSKAVIWGSEQNWRVLGGDAGQAARGGSFKSVAIHGAAIEELAAEDSVEAARLAAIVEGFVLGRYQYLNYKSKKKLANKTGKDTAEKTAPAKEPALTIITSKPLVKRSAAIFKGAAAAGLRRSDAVVFCRDLVNRPPSDLHPADLVKTAKKIASRRGSRITLKVFGRNKLKAMGANGILTVARGSAIEPFLIHATYKPAKTSRNTKRIVLVGKGVTFDSGGLSIKTGKGMEDMKCDMAGAAAVISVLKAITDAPPAARPEHEIHVLVPTVENLINENSVKPGDVFYALNGKSVEVLNTDAEGRLILADALSYSERLKPDLMVDLATLTGACVAALGSDYAGLFSTDSKLEAELIAAGKSSGDLVWPLPLAPEYRFAINSSVADIQNIGPGGPGAITAALFLKEFVPAKTHWAHLDIAGPAFVTRGNEVVRPGGTGFGVRLLLKLLSSKGVA